MSSNDTSKLPPIRSAIITRNHIQASTSTTHPVERQSTVLITPVMEQVIRRLEFLFDSPTRGTLTLKKLRNNTQEINSMVDQRTEEDRSLRYALSLTRAVFKSHVNTNTQNTTQQGETPDIQIDQLFEQEEKPQSDQHPNIQSGGPPPTPPASSSSPSKESLDSKTSSDPSSSERAPMVEQVNRPWLDDDECTDCCPI